MTDIASPHDHFFHLTLNDLEAAREFITRLFPKDVIAKINLASLKSCDSAFISRELKLRIVDKLFQVEFVDKRKGYLYTLAEHQSTPCKIMPFRALQYRFCIWDHHHQKTQLHEFPPILVVVFYHGKAEWHYSQNFFDLIAPAHQAEMSGMLEHTFELIDVNHIPDETLRQQTKFGLMALTMKYIYRQDLINILERVSDIITYLARTGQKEYIISSLIYVFETGKVDDAEIVLNYVKNTFRQVVGEHEMKTVAQYLREEAKKEGIQQGLHQGIQQGLHQGIQQGLHQGIQQGKLESALEMLREGFAIEKIARITKLDTQEILDAAGKSETSFQH